MVLAKLHFSQQVRTAGTRTAPTSCIRGLLYRVSGLVATSSLAHATGGAAETPQLSPRPQGRAAPGRPTTSVVGLLGHASMSEPVPEEVALVIRWRSLLGHATGAAG